MENKDKAVVIDCKIIKKAIFILLMNKKHESKSIYFDLRRHEQKWKPNFSFEEKDGNYSRLFG
ncbi:MAG TPA: hypothetical protein VFM11_11800 [Burkholderiales bacterium]|nr:hypothetical protein [Burkholderiales bacterium]